jgi:hypothetical protein
MFVDDRAIRGLERFPPLLRVLGTFFFFFFFFITLAP